VRYFFLQFYKRPYLIGRVRNHWIDKFIRADIEGLAELYAEDVLNDQVVFSKQEESL
jgi:hypothetical protein